MTTRFLRIFAVLVVTVLLGVFAWWWLAVRPYACDPAALRRGIEEAHRERAKHPAWIGDHGLGAAWAMDTLLAACPNLPEDLHARLEARLPFSVEDMRPLSTRPYSPPNEEYQTLLDRACADQSVFADAGTMPGEVRRSEIVRRCRLYDVGLGDATERVLDHLSSVGFVLYLHLLDKGIEPHLARETVLLWAYPDLERTVTTAVPTSTQIAPVEDGIFVRLTTDGLLMPGGMTPRAGRDPRQPVVAWLDEQLDEAYAHQHVAVVAEAAAPACLLADLAEAALANDVDSTAVVVRGEDGRIGGEPVSYLHQAAAQSHHISSYEGRLELMDVSTGARVVSATAADALPELARWAAGIADRPEILVAIDLHDFTVQQLVDVLVALRGGAACTLLGEQDDSGCHLVEIGVFCPDHPEMPLPFETDRG